MMNAATVKRHSNGGGSAETCRSLEASICEYLGYNRATSYHSHADAFTKDGKAVQIKTLLNNSPSISFGNFKACYDKGIENPTAEQVVTEYFEGLDVLVAYVGKDKNEPFDGNKCIVMDRENAIKWLACRCKMSYDHLHHPQYKIRKNPVKA